MKEIFSAAVTKTGRRQNNQDNFMLSGVYAELEHDAFKYRSEGNSGKPFFAAVCDGMGGETAGERASFVACSELNKASARLSDNPTANKRAVTESILEANNKLCEFMQSEHSGRMGSTVAAVLIQNDELFFTNLGDSRIYFAREGSLSQITKDHTEGQLMVDAGVLTPEQLKTHPSRNKLNRHLGISSDELHLECPVYGDIALLPGDRLLLVSDGVFGVLDDGEMSAVLFGSLSAEEKAEKLVDLAYEKGSRDNMTAMVIEIEAALEGGKPRTGMGADVRNSSPQPSEKPGRSLPAAAVIAIIAAASLILILLLIGVIAKLGGEPEATPEPTIFVSDAPDASAAPETSGKPTEIPSVEPTEAVTEKPTDAPTEVPTEAPTESPTEAPTEAPSEAPAESPAETGTP